MYKYAQIDDDGKVIGVQESDREISVVNLIDVTADDVEIGMIYDGSEFSEVPEVLDDES